MRILLTGASGFLGQEVYHRLKEAKHKVYGMSRNGPDVIGDITVPDLKLKKPPKNLDMVIHCAAYLSFSPHQSKKLYEVNSRGTSNVCTFCQDNNVGRLVYISTAYVCGDFKGEWTEQDFYRGQKFKNPYEESKFWGESYVRESSRNLLGVFSPLKVTIFRPGVIMGSSVDGKATAFEGFYAPIRAMVKVMNLFERKLGFPKRERLEELFHLPKLHLPIAIKGDPNSTLNIVPVDWVAQKIVDLMCEEGTFHLTNPQPPTNSQVCEAICEALGITGPHLDRRARLLQPHDKIYNRLVKDFSPYLWNEPRFASSVNSSFTLTGDYKGYIIKAVNYWRRMEEENGSTRATKGHNPKRPQ